MVNEPFEIRDDYFDSRKNINPKDANHIASK